jgi:hypothetical protein
VADGEKSVGVPPLPLAKEIAEPRSGSAALRRTSHQSREARGERDGPPRPTGGAEHPAVGKHSGAIVKRDASAARA